MREFKIWEIRMILEAVHQIISRETQVNFMIALIHKEVIVWKIFWLVPSKDNLIIYWVMMMIKLMLEALELI